jgi:hypothetical protein
MEGGCLVVSFHMLSKSGLWLVEKLEPCLRGCFGSGTREC